MINGYHLICTGNRVKITGYRLIYTAYHETGTGVNQAVIFKFIFYIIFNRLQKGFLIVVTGFFVTVTAYRIICTAIYIKSFA